MKYLIGLTCLFRTNILLIIKVLIKERGKKIKTEHSKYITIQKEYAFTFSHENEIFPLNLQLVNTDEENMQPENKTGIILKLIPK